MVLLSMDIYILIYFHFKYHVLYFMFILTCCITLPVLLMWCFSIVVNCQYFSLVLVKITSFFEEWILSNIHIYGCFPNNTAMSPWSYPSLIIYRINFMLENLSLLLFVILLFIHNLFMTYNDSLIEGGYCLSGYNIFYKFIWGK